MGARRRAERPARGAATAQDREAGGGEMPTSRGTFLIVLDRLGSAALSPLGSLGSGVGSGKDAAPAEIIHHY